MNFNESTRKNISNIILEKTKKLEELDSNFFSLINTAAEDICSPDNEDYQNRNLLLEYIDLYNDCLNELKYIDKYKFDTKNVVTKLIKRENIDISNYIPFWNQATNNSKMCGENKDIPINIKDLHALWKPFFKFSKGMPRIFLNMDKKNDVILWNDNFLRAKDEDEKTTRPIIPDKKLFSNLIVKDDEFQKRITLKQVLNDFRKNIFLDGNNYRDFTNIFNNIGNDVNISIMLEKSKSSNDELNGFSKYYKNDYKITLHKELENKPPISSVPLIPIGASFHLIDKDEYADNNDIEFKVSVSSVETLGALKQKPEYQNVIGPYNIRWYKDSSFMTEVNDSDTVYPSDKLYADNTHKDPNGKKYADSITNNMHNGQNFIFMSNDKKTFGMATIKNIEKILVPYKNTKVYEVNIIFHFDTIYNYEDNKSLNIFKGNVKDVTEIFIKKMLEIMRNNLTNAFDAYNNANKNMAVADGDPEGRYPVYIKYINDFINAQNYDIKTIKRIESTINNTIFKWIFERENFLLKSVKDEGIGEAIYSIISDRMDKNNGTLYSWHSQKLNPIIGEYNRLSTKKENYKYLFKNGILVIKDAGIDYTQKENGGKELENPSFIDILYNGNKYYKEFGYNVNFNVGDTVYIIDGINPEIVCSIISIYVWSASIGFKEVDGSVKGALEQVIRINLSNSIPTSFEKYDTLRIVKRY